MHKMLIANNVLFLSNWFQILLSTDSSVIVLFKFNYWPSDCMPWRMPWINSSAVAWSAFIDANMVAALRCLPRCFFDDGIAIYDPVTLWYGGRAGIVNSIAERRSLVEFSTTS